MRNRKGSKKETTTPKNVHLTVKNCGRDDDDSGRLRVTVSPTDTGYLTPWRGRAESIAAARGLRGKGVGGVGGRGG